ncbi:hypothetical protein PoB_007042400 [Plakobranchus ocellatus]|uniref:Uncharacterized protein n=1 Tax=Plakobranchus ocellatus TaxID=259542 RepID=A0AAV4DIS6_9GAST|nr:hypothetical protein PoB_007042400 [Plakobranchus ocellatus]
MNIGYHNYLHNIGPLFKYPDEILPWSARPKSRKVRPPGHHLSIINRELLIRRWSCRANSARCVFHLLCLACVYRQFVALIWQSIFIPQLMLFHGPRRGVRYLSLSKLTLNCGQPGFEANSSELSSLQLHTNMA